MHEDPRAYWDERYRSRESEGEREPAEFLVQHVELLPPKGTALDLAMGTGRNALYLASLGYEVTGVDISPVGIERCLEEAKRRGLQIETVCAAAEDYAFPKEAFNVVMNFYFLERSVCPSLVETLKPGGVLVFETFTLSQKQFGWGPSNDEVLLQPGELASLFPQLETLVYREGLFDEGDRGMKAIAGLVARKPAG